MDSLHGGVDFVLSNPPSSQGDDGFGFRREVLRGREFLKKGGKAYEYYRKTGSSPLTRWQTHLFEAIE